MLARQRQEPGTSSVLQRPTLRQQKPRTAPNQAAFSKFLDVARQTSDDDRTEQKGDSASETSVDKQGEGKKDGAIEAKDTNRDDQRSSSGENGGDDNPGLATAPILAPDRASDTGTAVPQARAILHVADLERIVSSVRSDSFAGAKQVTIDLKNSVLEGLRIQLTLTEQGTIKAEFLAVNEEIKKQLDAAEKRASIHLEGPLDQMQRFEGDRC